MKRMGLYLRKIFIFAFLALMLIEFPVFMNDKLYDITKTKFLFCVFATLGCAFFYLISRFMSMEKIQKDKVRWYDLAGLAFLLSTALSTLISDHKLEALTGSSGRYLGLIIYVIYAIMIALVISEVKWKELVLVLAEVGACVVGILGILNHYFIDPLHVYENMKMNYIFIMTSTLGNVDLFSMYMGIIYVIALLAFLMGTPSKTTYFSMATAMICSVAIMLNAADVGYLAIALAIIAAGFMVKTQRQIARLFLMIWFLFAQHFYLIVEAHSGLVAGNLVNNISDAMYSGMVLNIEGVWVQRVAGNIDHFAKILSTPIIVGVIGSLLLVIIGYLYCMEIEVKSKNLFKIIWSVLVGLAVLLVVLLLVMANVVIGEAALESSFWKQFYLKADFGGDRFLYMKCFFAYFLQSDWIHKLFGCGPDTLIYVTETNEGIKAFLETFLGGATMDNAHCEFMQLLITHGFLATLCYYIWMIGCIVDALRDKSEDYLRKAFALAVMAYLIMSMISINLIHVTAIVMLFVATCRVTEEKDVYGEKE